MDWVTEFKMPAHVARKDFHCSLLRLQKCTTYSYTDHKAGSQKFSTMDPVIHNFSLSTLQDLVPTQPLPSAPRPPQPLTHRTSARWSPSNCRVEVCPPVAAVVAAASLSWAVCLLFCPNNNRPHRCTSLSLQQVREDTQCSIGRIVSHSGRIQINLSGWSLSLIIITNFLIFIINA